MIGAKYGPRISWISEEEKDVFWQTKDGLLKLEWLILRKGEWTFVYQYVGHFLFSHWKEVGEKSWEYGDGQQTPPYYRKNAQMWTMHQIIFQNEPSEEAHGESHWSEAAQVWTVH